MDDEKTNLIREIAAKHNIAIGRDDPIWVLLTMNEQLIKNFEQAQAEMLEQFKSELEDLSLRWGNDAKEKAERIVNASLNASKESMNGLMGVGAEEIVAALKTEITSSLSLIKNLIKDAYRISFLNLLASCFTILAAVIVLWVSIHK